MEENNKLIAEFMDLSIKEGVCYYTDADDILYEEPYIPYDDDWNWLMPVVEKIMWDNDIADDSCTKIADALCDAKIDRVYEAVVEFIKFYNQNK